MKIDDKPLVVAGNSTRDRNRTAAMQANRVADADLMYGLGPESESDETSALGAVEYASWLSSDILLVVGRFPGQGGEQIDASLVVEGQAVVLDTRCMAYPRPDVAGMGTRAGKVLTLCFPPGEGVRDLKGTLQVRSGDETFTLAPANLSQELVSLQSLVRGSLSGLEPEIRTRIVEFVAGVTGQQLGRKNSVRLSKTLFAFRQALRERLPLCVISAEHPQGLGIDAVLALDEKSFFISGWTWDSESEITRLIMVSPEGSRVNVAERVYRYRRSDIEHLYGVTPDDYLDVKPGFFCYFELEAPSHLTTGWLVELHNADGSAVETEAPQVIRDSVAVRNRILGEIAQERPPHQELKANHAFPALSRLQEKHMATVVVESVDQYGEPPEAPEVSIIVPLYQRVDFLEHQMAQFVDDPEIHRADLIYVLDSPELAEGFRHLAGQLHRLYRVPFRVASLRRNSGYSAANNVGASLARGRLLVLLNSDVIPDKPGWLGEMRAFYDSTPNVGAVGAKLLYEDDSIQHAGMFFTYQPINREWENKHYFKGLHRRLPAANMPRPVPAVTGACMMVSAELYHKIGGLRGLYVQGDFEDSDLCLRLADLGYESWYLPTAELYHLEGQSYGYGELRTLMSRYNAWVHTWLWDGRIREIMAGKL